MAYEKNHYRKLTFLPILTTTDRLPAIRKLKVGVMNKFLSTDLEVDELRRSGRRIKYPGSYFRQAKPSMHICSVTSLYSKEFGCLFGLNLKVNMIFRMATNHNN